MDTQQVRELMECFSRAGLKSLRLTEGEFTLELEAAYGEAPLAPVAAAPVAAPVAVGVVPAQQQEPAGVPVTAPVVGIFYAGSAPGAEPFVKVGQQVKQGETLCIIEAMKMMNEIPAPTSGTVTAIEVEAGQLVSFDQVIMRIEER